MLFNSWWKLGSGPKVEFFLNDKFIQRVIHEKRDSLKGFQEFERWLIFYPPPPFILGKYLGKWRFRIKPISRSIIITNQPKYTAICCTAFVRFFGYCSPVFFLFFFTFSASSVPIVRMSQAFSFSLVCRTGQHSMRGVLHSFRSVPFPLNPPILHRIHHCCIHSGVYF